MIDIRVIFEDEYLCVVDKPGGIVVNNADSVKDVTLQQWFVSRLVAADTMTEFWQKGGIVHRLDKDTSGVMVLAKTLEAYEGLKQQFLERKTQKTYLALVHGTLKESQGIVSLPIERYSKNKSKFAIGTDLSRMAITEWRVKETYVDYCLVELKPHTGRTHQLRVHLQHMGHPIVSDPIYGWRKWLKEDLVFCPRLFLHATQLEFTHPVTGTLMTFDSPLPFDLAPTLSRLVHSM